MCFVACVCMYVGVHVDREHVSIHHWRPRRWKTWRTWSGETWQMEWRTTDSHSKVRMLSWNCSSFIPPLSLLRSFYVYLCITVDFIGFSSALTSDPPPVSFALCRRLPVPAHALHTARPSRDHLDCIEEVRICRWPRAHAGLSVPHVSAGFIFQRLYFPGTVEGDVSFNAEPA